MRKKRFLLTILIVFFASLISSSVSSADIEDSDLVMDIQISSFSDNTMLKDFTPRCSTAVVFAVDKDQTSFRPSSWKELEKTPVAVGFENSPLIKRALIASASFGLMGENYKSNSAYMLFQKLQKNNLLSIGEKEQPITLCFDFQAARRIQNGENLYVAIPSDGTFLFDMGTLSGSKGENISDSQLIDSCYRLNDGRCLSNLYPSSDEYINAHKIKNFNKFHRETRFTSSKLTRRVLGTYLLSPADTRENTLTIVIVSMLIIIWAVIAVYRIPQREIKRYTFLISGALISWLYLSMLKYLIGNNLLTHYLWYSYYIFLLGLPLSLLYIVTIFDSEKIMKISELPIALRICILCYPLFILLVYTNDITEAVFSFPDPKKTDDLYNYEAGYYAICFYGFFMFFSALTILIKKSRKSPKKNGPLMPIAISCLIFSYHICYMLRVPIIKDTNMTLIYSLQIIMFLEVLISSRMIPANTHYKEVFAISALNIRILDEKGDTVISPSNADEIKVSEVETVITSPGKDFNKNKYTTIHSKKIPGGFVVWEEDVTLIRDTGKTIERSIKKIENANLLLLKERDVRKKLVSVKIQAEIFESLEKDIAEKNEELHKAFNELDTTSNKESQFSYIAILLCFIKRYCNLFLCAQQDSCIPSYEFTVYLDELSEFAGYGKVNSLVRNGLCGNIKIKTAMLLYEFYFVLLSTAMNGTKETMIGIIRDSSNEINFTITTGGFLDSLEFPKRFQTEVKLHSATIIRKCQEDSETISLILNEGKKHD